MNKRGKRYSDEPKLNVKKVFGVVIAIAVIIMVIITIKNICKNGDKEKKSVITRYYTAYENNSFGVINNLGETVINPEYEEFIIIPDSTKDIFVCTYDVNDEDGTYKTKVINSKNEELFAGNEEIEALDNIDSKGNIWYEKNLLRIKKDGKWGLIDFEGKEVVPCEYDQIETLTGVESNIVIKKDGLVGLINDKGQTILDIKYSNIIALEDNYKNEYIVSNSNNKYGLVSTTGKEILELNYEEIKTVNNSSAYACKLDGVWKLINNEGTAIIEDGYEDIVNFKGENIVVKKDGKFGVINTSKEEIIPIEYDDLKYTFSIYYIAKKDGKFGIISPENASVIPFEYIGMEYIEKAGFIEAETANYETTVFDSNLIQKFTGIISEINTDKGYIKAYINGEYKYYNFKFEEKENYDLLSQNTLFLSKKDNKYGYIDKSGNIIVDYKYDDGTEQNADGYCAVKKDGVWGSLNKIGAECISPSVNLDDSIYIDFVGAWHISSDGLYYIK